MSSKYCGIRLIILIAAGTGSLAPRTPVLLSLICMLFTANAAIAKKRVAIVVGTRTRRSGTGSACSGAACGHARIAPLDLLRLHFPEIGLLHHRVVA
jgi:hypothetical protein